MIRNQLTAITLQHLQVFYSVAETLNLTQSAYDLNLSPSTVSKSLAKLESILGYALFERTSKNVHLTAMGTASYGAWMGVLPMMEAGYANVTANPLAYKEEINVVFSLTLDYEFLYRQLVEGAKTTLPYVKLKFGDNNMINIPSFLEDGKDDLAFMPDVNKYALDSHNLSWCYVKVKPMCAVVSEKHPLASVDSAQFSDILDIPIITNPPERNSAPFIQLKDMYRAYGQTPTVMAYYTCNYEIQTLLQNNNCLLIVDPYFPDVYLSGCKKIPLTDAPGGILAVWSKKNTKPSLAKLVQMAQQG